MRGRHGQDDLFGLVNDEIAARLNTPRQVVSKWRQAFH